MPVEKYDAKDWCVVKLSIRLVDRQASDNLFGFRPPKLAKRPHILGLKRKAATKYRFNIETKIDWITSKLT